VDQVCCGSRNSVWVGIAAAAVAGEAETQAERLTVRSLPPEHLDPLRHRHPHGHETRIDSYLEVSEDGPTIQQERLVLEI